MNSYEPDNFPKHAEIPNYIRRGLAKSPTRAWRARRRLAVSFSRWLVPLVQRLQNSPLTSWIWSYWQHEDTGSICISIRKPSRRHYRMRLRD